MVPRYPRPCSNAVFLGQIEHLDAWFCSCHPNKNHPRVLILRQANANSYGQVAVEKLNVLRSPGLEHLINFYREVARRSCARGLITKVEADF